MSAFRIEYLPKPGMDIKMVRQGFDTADSAQRYAYNNLRGAVLANITQHQRIVKKLWEKDVCINYVNDESPKRCWQTFDSKEQLVAHIAAVHALRPRRSA